MDDLGSLALGNDGDEDFLLLLLLLPVVDAGALEDRSTLIYSSQKGRV